jgi:hypothetical protein
LIVLSKTIQSDSIEEFRRQVERSREHLDLVLCATNVLSAYQNVWKPKYNSAKTEEEKESLLCDLAVLRAKIRIIDEIEGILFPENAMWFRDWKAKRRAGGSLEMIYDY